MKIIGKAILLSVPVIVLTSCSSFAPQPTETPIPIETSLLTAANTPDPATSPTKSPIPPTETLFDLNLTLPSGKPASEWEGIPIMPNAIAGAGDSIDYSFTINATLVEIQSFYEKELGKQGWDMVRSGQFTSNVTSLIFVKDTRTLSASIIPQPDGIMYVLLVK